MSEIDTLGAAGSHQRWWTALPAVPSGPSSPDWWGKDDRRATPYTRLKRCWADYTMVGGAKDDPDRPHWFYTPGHGLHLCVALWENFKLWDPSQWVPELFRIAGLPPVASVRDACWSYEFRTHTGMQKPLVKQVDLVLHVRTESGQQLVAIEAKATKDKLKTSEPLPDTDPSSYRDLPVFRALTEDRHAVYLVPESYCQTVRKRVNGEYGLISWESVLGLQIALGTARHGPLVGQRLAAIGRTLGLHAKDCEVSPSRGGNTPEDVVRNWTISADAYLRGLEAGGTSDPVFSYVTTDPTFRELHEMPSRQRTELCPDHMAEYWRLP